MSENITAVIDDLFRYVQDYETESGGFNVEAFINTYNGIKAVFQPLREQRRDAVEVDQLLLERIRQVHLSKSDLRQLTIQVLLSYFNAIANTDGTTNKAYYACRQMRKIPMDVRYFEEELMPLLTREGSLKGHLDLNRFFLEQIGKYIKEYGGSFKGNVTPEEFKGMPIQSKILILYLRRLELGNALVRDRNSLEFHMRRESGEFEKMTKSYSIADYYLDSQWKYIEKIGFWTRVKGFVGLAWARFRGSLTSMDYVKLSVAQRPPAYIYYLLIIVIFLFLALAIPLVWSNYRNSELEKFNNRIDAVEAAEKKSE